MCIKIDRGVAGKFGEGASLAQSTGIPVAMASKMGRPTPSAIEGKTEASAQIRALVPSWGKCPVKKYLAYAEAATTL